MKRHQIALLAATLGFVVPTAQPANVSTTFNVQASISAACSVSATTLNFGSYSPAGATPSDSSSTVSVYCTSGTSYTVKFDVGNGGGSYTSRTLASGSDTLNFNLYTTAGRTVVLGDGTSSSQSLSGSGAGLLTANTHTVYGRIAAGQDKPTGNYQSTVTVTVEYT